MYQTTSLYSHLLYSARYQYAQADAGNGFRGERGLYHPSGEVELYREVVQADVHRLVVYRGVRVVSQNPLPEAIKKEKIRHV